MEWNTAGRSCDDFSPSAVLRRNPKRNSAVHFKSINWPSLKEISVQVNWQAGVCPTLACVSQTETVWTVPNHGSQFSICLFFFSACFLYLGILLWEPGNPAFIPNWMLLRFLKGFWRDEKFSRFWRRTFCHYFSSLFLFLFLKAGMRFCSPRQLHPEQGLKNGKGCW